MFAEWEACTECNLDLEKWYEGIYSNKFKAHVIAFHQLRQQVQNHVQDAQNAEAEKQAKRRR